jgi:hypothetical protein
VGVQPGQFSKENAFPIGEDMGPQLNAVAVDALTRNVVTDSPDPLLPRRLFFTSIPSMTALISDPASYNWFPSGQAHMCSRTG